MSKGNRKAIFLMIICTIVIAFGMLFLKKGMNAFDSIPIYTNYFLMSGMILYGLGAILLIVALKHGELSVTYPILALNFVWVAVLSRLFLHEPIGWAKITAILLVVIGVGLIGAGGK